MTKRPIELKSYNKEGLIDEVLGQFFYLQKRTDAPARKAHIYNIADLPLNNEVIITASRSTNEEIHLHVKCRFHVDKKITPKRNDDFMLDAECGTIAYQCECQTAAEFHIIPMIERLYSEVDKELRRE